eukprot:2249623-Amphidinium_carterae.1
MSLLSEAAFGWVLSGRKETGKHSGCKCSLSMFSVLFSSDRKACDGWKLLILEEDRRQRVQKQYLGNEKWNLEKINHASKAWPLSPGFLSCPQHPNSQ